MKQVTYFSVLPLSVYSYHCPISFALKTKAFHIDKECNNFLLQKHLISFGIMRRKIYTNLF